VSRWPALGLLLLGCSSLGEGDSVVALEVRTPQPAVVEQHDTIRLQARALNLQGDSVAATITWVAADTLLQVSGADSLTTVYTSGIGRVQARVGSLRSELVSVTARRRSDSLALSGGGADTVAAVDSASGPLVAAVLSLAPDTAGIGGTRIHYAIEAAAVGTVRFAGDASEVFAITGSTGEPAVAVTLRRVPGTAQPASVRVTVDAVRPSGRVVPGSGQSFTVVFE